MVELAAFQGTRQDPSRVDIGRTTFSQSLSNTSSRAITIKGDNLSWTITDFRHWEGMKHFSDEIRNKVNVEIREHIKEALTNAIASTKKQISYNTKLNRRYGSRTLTQVLGESLKFGLKSGANQFQSNFIIGSYDKDENPPSTPTGVRSKTMNKNEKSLTEIYEQGVGPFTMKGFIGSGATDPGLTGFFRRGQSGAAWKQKQDAAGRIFISEKGYGKNQNRTGKNISKVTRDGWRGVEMIGKLHDNVQKELEQGKPMLKQRLEAITSRFKPQTGNQNDPGSLAYYSFKGQ